METLARRDRIICATKGSTYAVLKHIAINTRQMFLTENSRVHATGSYSHDNLMETTFSFLLEALKEENFICIHKTICRLSKLHLLLHTDILLTKCSLIHSKNNTSTSTLEGNFRCDAEREQICNLRFTVFFTLPGTTPCINPGSCSRISFNLVYLLTCRNVKVETAIIFV